MSTLNENIDENPYFSKVSLKNVLSIDLWKIPHLENIDGRPNFSRVSSKMYQVWTSEKFDTQEIAMIVQTSQGFHQNLRSVNLWKILHSEKIDERQTSQEFHRNVLSLDLWKIPHSEKIDDTPNFSKVSLKMY